MATMTKTTEKESKVKERSDEFAEENERPEVSGVNWERLREAVILAVVILCSLIYLVISARNTLTWHLERFWGGSRDFWQSLWEPIHSAFGGNDFLLAFIGTGLTTTVSFWGTNLIFMLIDFYGYPEFITQYKIQEDKNVPLDKKKLRNAIKVCLFNHVIISGPFSAFMYVMMKWRGCDFGSQLPSFHWVILELIVYILVEEIMFYYSHRTLHHPLIYKHIHKKHHEWTAPIGIITIYAHPVEHVISNLIPVMCGPVLMGSHIATAWLWFSLALFTSTISHCGYHLPLLFSPEFHDYHHLKFNYNYGVLGLLDRLHGTDKLFREAYQFQRHQVLLGLTPMSKQYPHVGNGKVIPGKSDGRTKLE